MIGYGLRPASFLWDQPINELYHNVLLSNPQPVQRAHGFLGVTAGVGKSALVERLHELDDQHVFMDADVCAVMAATPSDEWSLTPAQAALSYGFNFNFREDKRMTEFLLRIDVISAAVNGKFEALVNPPYETYLARLQNRNRVAQRPKSPIDKSTYIDKCIRLMHLSPCCLHIADATEDAARAFLRVINL